MNEKNIFRENRPLQVYDENNQPYKSIIQEVEEDYIAIGIPMRRQDRMLMEEGSDWSFVITIEDALYYFQSEVIGRKKSGNIPLYLIAWPQKLYRRQRRHFFRFACSLEVSFWVLYDGDLKAVPENLPAGGNSPKQKEELRVLAGEASSNPNPKYPLEKLVSRLGRPQKGVVADISGGGVLLVLHRRIPEGSLLLLDLLLQSKKEEKQIRVRGKVVRIEKIEVDRDKRYRHGIEFFGMEEKLRDEIVGFVFTLSRERIQ